MIKNHLKIAIRYLLRYKDYTVINILGLAVGITCCLLIMLFVRNEFSYDRFHQNAPRLVRAWQHEKVEGQDFINVVNPLPLGPALQSSFPEFAATCRVIDLTAMAKKGEQTFNESIVMVDSTFFNIFSFPLRNGNPAQTFPQQNSIVITPAIAEKYFGNENAVGKSILVKLDSTYENFIVSAIAEPAPTASSIRYSMLIPFSNAHKIFRERLFHSWGNVFGETYGLLKPNVQVAALEKKLPQMVKQQLGEDYKEGAYTVHLQPITDIHLNNTLPAGNQPISNPKYSYILSSVGLLILLIACINFITLSIGRSTSRAKEVGVRKVLGAERSQLIKQFWGEAFLLTLIAVTLGFVFAVLLLNPFNELIRQQLSFNFDLGFFGFGLLLIAFIAIVAGIYPAVILSGFNPMEVLKSKLAISRGSGLLRHGLIVGQFVVSIAMIVCTLGIGQQMKYVQKMDLGYAKDQVMIVPTNKTIREGTAFAALYREELLKHPEVESVTTSVYSFAETPWCNVGYTDDKKVYRNFQFNRVDANFIPALQIKLVAGRNFQPGNSADDYGSILVNESLVKEYGWKEPIGQKLPGPYEERIVGVVKDFNYESLHTKVKPLVLALKHDSILRHSQDVSFAQPPQPRVSVRMKGGNPVSNQEILKKAWMAVAPNEEFTFSFLDDRVASQYESEKRTDKIVKLAAGLSIFIACMGLFGLVTLTVIKRTKEISIRKVLGATSGSIATLLASYFVKLVVIASLVAFPLAWWALNQWLGDFAYKTTISWWLFAAAGLSAILIALITVSAQAIKAALANPVKNLRSE